MGCPTCGAKRKSESPRIFSTEYQAKMAREAGMVVKTSAGSSNGKKKKPRNNWDSANN